jgi:S-adenosylmethionine hydrolase
MLMTQPIITLTTDFGTDSPYVAQMKGVILAIHPAVTLVDLTHAVRPQDIRYGAVVLEDVTPRFPAGTLHVAVVDPGVGTARQLVYAECGSQRYLAPDNGLLSRVAAASPPTRLIALTQREYWLPQVSHTFHGRDILAPAAAHLSCGLPPERLGEPLERLAGLDWPAVTRVGRTLTGAVLWLDAFGNVITNVTAQMLAECGDPQTLLVTCAGAAAHGIVRTYGERPKGELIALLGSSGRLELAVVGGSAAQRLHVQPGDPVRAEAETP